MMYYPDDCLRFGVNKGYSLEEIYHYNPSYLEFLIKYNQHFEIDIEDFEGLNKPVRVSFGKKSKRLSVEEMMEIEPEKLIEYDYKFSDELIEILELKKLGEYVAPEYIRKGDIDIRKPDIEPEGYEGYI